MLREEWVSVLSLLPEPADGSAPSANGIESQRLSCWYLQYGRLEL